MPISKKGPARSDPNDPFKRATSGTLRAIAGKEDLEVSYGTDRASLIDVEARLPEPPRKMSATDIAVTRGHADALALRVACHDPKIHQKMMPVGPNARAAFEAVEQARVEAIGCQRMAGVAQNISAMLESNFSRPEQATGEMDEKPLLDQALGLLLRERMAGIATPPQAREIVETYRSWINDKAGAEINRLCDVLEDQKEFAGVVRDMLSALDMADELGEDPDADSTDDDDEQPDENDESDADSDAEQMADSAEAREVEEGADEDTEDGTAESVDTDMDMTGGDDDDDSAQDSSEPWRPDNYGSNERSPDIYRVFTAKYDEVVNAEELCDPEEMERLRGFLDKQLVNLHSAVARLANRLQRRLMAQQTRAWDFDLEEGILGCCKAVTGGDRPFVGAVVQGRA